MKKFIIFIVIFAVLFASARIITSTYENMMREMSNTEVVK